jgi:uncharacterized membrane protein
MAIAALVLGILSFMTPYVGIALAIVGLVLGVTAKKQLAETGESESMATAGIIISFVGIIWGIFGIVMCALCGATNLFCAALGL